MSMKAGTSTEFSGSLAEAIEHAFIKEWPNVMGKEQTVESNPQMRLLCIAIAQGVIGYFKDHASDSIRVDLATTPQNSNDGYIDIMTTGTLY